MSDNYLIGMYLVNFDMPVSSGLGVLYPNFNDIMRRYIIILLFLPVIVCAQDPDRRAVYNSAMSYIDAIYDVDPVKIAECVHLDLVKRGFYWKGNEQDFSELVTITYDQLVSITKEWNKEGWLPDDAPKEVEILDLQEHIAIVKVTAYWGVDYLQLVKTQNRWLILNILWQNIPRRKDEAGVDNE